MIFFKSSKDIMYICQPKEIEKDWWFRKRRLIKVNDNVHSLQELLRHSSQDMHEHTKVRL